MQLCLTRDELELLKRIFQEDDRFSRTDLTSSLQIAADTLLRDKLLIAQDLLRGSLSSNLQLGYDELEDLADSLRQRKKDLNAEICRSQEGKSKYDLECKALISEHLLEKVTEACAMV